MKFFYILFLTMQLICVVAAITHKTKVTCVCDKTEPYRCECKECNCENED